MKTKKNTKTKPIHFIIGGMLLAGVVGATYAAFDQYDQKVDMITLAEAEKEEMSAEVLESYAKIESNLAEITAHESALRMNLVNKNKEGVMSPEERIENEIAVINMLIDRNRELISDLKEEVGENNQQIAAYDEQVSSLERRVKRYKKKAADLEEENEELNTALASAVALNKSMTAEVAAMQSANDDLQMQLNNQSTTVQELQDEINTVYYTVGDFSDLKDSDVAERDGGFIGIGGHKTLKDGFDQDQFIAVDKRHYTTIPVFSKKAELLTEHDSSSFEWVESDNNEVAWIKITDPEKFWEASNYLVVATRDGWTLSLNQ